MSLFRRQAWMGLLALVILLVPLTVLAQGDAVRIDGSRIVAGLVEPVANAYTADTGAAVNLEISGTNNGLARLCAGEIDIATAARSITRAEVQACADAGVDWVEVLLGYDALAVITNPTNSFAQCLALPQLALLFGPSATNNITTWNQVNASYQAIPFVLDAPPTDDTTFNLLDELLPGDGLRTDFTNAADAAAAVSAIAEDVAGLGFAPLSAVQASDAELQVINIDDLSGSGCVEPTQDNIEQGLYAGARGLFLYVNAASLDREPVAGLLDALLGESGQTAATDNGFLLPSTDLAAQVADNVSNRVTGRAFSQGEALFTIPLDVSGTVAAQDAALGYDMLNLVGTSFSASYAGVTVSAASLGNAAAYRDLCAGDADLAAVTRPPTADETDACATAGADLADFALGNQALVMVVPAAADYAACLTTGQVTTLWQDQGAETVTNWSQLGADFPDLAVSIFLPTDTRNETDYLLTQASGGNLNPRRDALETKADPLYRAAATANVEGAITYMTFQEYQDVTSDVMLVAVDAGDGCVAPALDTIRDGSYALSNPVMLVANQAALARSEVQSFVWYLLRPLSLSDLSGMGLIPLGDATLAGYDEQVVGLFADAEAAAAALEALPTAEPTAEATLEPTIEATVEAPTEPTAEPTTGG